MTANPSNPSGATRRDWRLFIIGLAIHAAVVAVAATVLGPGTHYLGDEDRFIQTSRQFEFLPSVDVLRHYEEMSAPLPFWIMGQWGRLAGFDLAPMHHGMMLLSVAAAAGLLSWLGEMLDRPATLAAAFLLVILNPYWWTLSVFAYTDMVAMMFVLWAIWALSRDKAWLWALMLAGALLSRQYLVFLVPPVALWSLIRITRPAGRRRGLLMLAATCAGMVPLLLLFILWHGPSPDNQMSLQYRQGLFDFKPVSVALYVSLIGIYTLPLWVADKGFRMRLGLGRWLAGAAGCVWAMAFPVAPSPSSAQGGIMTVGLFDRLLEAARLSPHQRQGVFCVGCLFGAAILADLVFRAWSEINSLRGRENTPPRLSLCAGLAISFLLVMPLSYLHWEKYFLPLLPVVAVGLMARGRAKTDAPAIHLA